MTDHNFKGSQYVVAQWDVEEVLAECFEALEPQEKLLFFNSSEKRLIQFHSNFGMWIRNTFGLWAHKPELAASMCLPLDIHPDDLSFEIIKKLWSRGRPDGR